MDNMKWLAKRTESSSSSSDDDDDERSFGKSDLIVVAGDISHDLGRLEESFSYLLQQGSSVVFVPGNHEAWLSVAELDGGNSMTKLDRIYEMCQNMGVLTRCAVMVGGIKERPHALWIAPLESWYDGTLSIDGCEDLCEGFGRWPWVDFIRCRWPGFPPMGGPDKKIPRGLVDYFLDRNVELLRTVQESMVDQSPLPKPQSSSRALMTVSHFLPNKQCLPDWKDVESPVFLRDSWLDHGGGGVSAKFAKVAGTARLDQQIRSLQLPSSDDNDVRRFHLFGHSHRPKDFELENIRYIHNPLGKPREREIYMVSPTVGFQTVWDTRSGEVAGENVIRYWEEQGGGIEALRSRMLNSKRRSRYGGHKHYKLQHPEGSPQSSRMNQNKRSS
jgi:hypothetical protein